VLFRRISTRTRKDPSTQQTRELFLTLQREQRDAIRSKLLLCLQNEETSNVRNKISDAVGEIARQYTDESGLLLSSFYLELLVADWWEQGRTDVGDNQINNGQNYSEPSSS
jgi:hypothetical protein